MTAVSRFRRIARRSEEFPGQLAALKPSLKGLVPDDINFSEDSYDELMAILFSALYYVKDAKLRKQSADRTGGNAKLVSVLMDEGVKDKDAILVEKILDRISPYVTVPVFMETLATMHADKARFFEFHSAIERIVADLFRISAGFDPHECCPKSLVRWASGPNRALLAGELFA
jgi:hypothetical protein